MFVIKSVLLLFPLFAMSQFHLTVNVKNVTSNDGKISVAVYDNAEGFLQFDQVFKADSAPSQKGTTEVVIRDLPEGRYALAVFHDENDNDKLDKNMLGIPKEPLGFSKGKMKTFGPPSFEECTFELTSDQTISVPIK
ncbi:DUF2141 domain-containing protein [Pricia sp. S334]|uniref:DUF2141 domain-containing protein n=1 Tax=Pricia mediterranea TaxID=3076079 RepID=A0ABU3L4K9_9FLAO|nr:DUF2141 domain-containing protein [Pricia sp. S334]MDT7828681.1 DUF2141 domain-containing protein [Pricia sp. S334]